MSAVILQFRRKPEDLTRAYEQMLSDAIKIQAASLKLLAACIAYRNALLGFTQPELTERE